MTRSDIKTVEEDLGNFGVEEDAVTLYIKIIDFLYY